MFSNSAGGGSLHTSYRHPRSSTTRLVQAKVEATTGIEPPTPRLHVHDDRAALGRQEVVRDVLADLPLHHRPEQERLGHDAAVPKRRSRRTTAARAPAATRRHEIPQAVADQYAPE